MPTAHSAFSPDAFIVATSPFISLFFTLLTVFVSARLHPKSALSEKSKVSLLRLVGFLSWSCACILAFMAWHSFSHWQQIKAQMLTRTTMTFLEAKGQNYAEAYNHHVLAQITFHYMQFRHNIAFYSVIVQIVTFLSLPVVMRWHSQRWERLAGQTLTLARNSHLH